MVIWGMVYYCYTHIIVGVSGVNMGLNPGSTDDTRGIRKMVLEIACCESWQRVFFFPSIGGRLNCLNARPMIGAMSFLRTRPRGPTLGSTLVFCVDCSTIFFVVPKMVGIAPNLLVHHHFLRCCLGIPSGN